MDKILTPEQYFLCKSGRLLKTIEDLKNALKNPDDVFAQDFEFHVLNSNNDFANWIRDIFEEKELAEKIRPIKNMDAMRKIILGVEEKQKIIDDIKKNVKDKEKNLDEKEQTIQDDVQTIEVSDETLRTEIEGFAKNSETKLDKIKAMKKRVFEKKVYIQQLVETAQEGYKELESEISDARRKGIDCFIPSLMMKQIKPEIAYLAVTGEQTDFEKITDLFEKIKEEIKDAKEFEEPNLKEEIIKAASQSIQKEAVQIEEISKKEDE